MKPVHLASIVAVSLVLAMGGPAAALIFAEIPGIPGDATIAGHEDEITVQSFSFSGGQVERKPGAKPCAPPSSKTEISALTIQKTADRATPKLVAAAAQGTVFPAITIAVAAFAGADVEDRVEYVLRNAFVRRYETSSDGEMPSESIELQFQSLELTHLLPTPETAAWNVCGVSP